MAALDYLLTYAGTPFINDWGRHIPLGPLPGDNVDFFAAKRQQPERNLLKELDRVLPFRWLQDFSPPSNYPSNKLNALAVQWSVGPNPNPQTVKIGDWFYPTGAGRWSVCRLLATSKMVKEMRSLTSGGKVAKKLSMMSVPASAGSPLNATYTIETDMCMLPPRPLGELGGDFDGLFLVTLVDDRWHWQGEPVNLTLTNSTTWADLVNTIATALGVTITAPTVPGVYPNPEPDSQLWTRNEDASFLLDAIGYNIGQILVRAYDGTYSFQTYSAGATQAEANRAALNPLLRMAGGDIFNTNTKLPAGNLSTFKNSVVPASITVSFPYYVYGADPVPHFSNSRTHASGFTTWYEDSYGDTYDVIVNISQGGASVTGLTGVGSVGLHSTAKAMIAEEGVSVPDNATTLDALALQLAQDFWDAQASVAFDEIYPGTYKWTPEAIHDIIYTWSEDRRQASTRVIHPEWNQIVKDFQHRTPEYSLVSGGGGKTVPLTVRGSGTGIQFFTNFIDIWGPNVSVSGEVTAAGIYKASVLISGGSVLSGVLTSGVVTSGYLGDMSVVSGSIASGSIGSIHISSGYYLLGSGSLTSGDIASGTVNWYDLASGYLDTCSGSHLVVEYGNGPGLVCTESGWQLVSSGTIVPYDLSSGVFLGQSGIVVEYGESGPVFSTSGVSTTLTSGQVQSGYLGDGAVVSGSIASGSIYWPHLSSGILTGQSGATIEYTESGVLISAPVGLSSGSVTSGYLGNDAVVSGNIASGQVSWPHMASGYLNVQSGIVVEYDGGPPTVGIGESLGGSSPISCFVRGAVFSGGGTAIDNSHTWHTVRYSGTVYWDTGTPVPFRTDGSGDIYLPQDGLYQVTSTVDTNATSGNAQFGWLHRIARDGFAGFDMGSMEVITTSGTTDIRITTTALVSGGSGTKIASTFLQNRGVPVLSFAEIQVVRLGDNP